MRIGDRQISGLTPRFYAIVGGIIFMIFAAVFFMPKGEQGVNYLYEPAFPTKDLTSKAFAKKDWIDPYISEFGIKRPESSAEILDNFGDYVGLPVRLKIYLPPQDAVKQTRGDLVFSKFGLTFTPGVVISPNQPVNAEDISALSAKELALQPTVVGFKNSVTPPGGQAYEVTGLVYWRSDLINPQEIASGETAPPPSPVLIVSSYSKLAPAELRAPTTQRVKLDLNVQEGPTEVKLNTIEWSSGRELRACVTLINTSNKTIPIWGGIAGTTADSGDSGAVEGAADESSALAQANELQPAQELSGYLVFGQDVSDPSQRLRLIMPSVATNSDSNITDKTLVDVPTSDIKKVGDQESNSCGAFSTKELSAATASAASKDQSAADAFSKGN